jgi:hypothetical protein
MRGQAKSGREDRRERKRCYCKHEAGGRARGGRRRGEQSERYAAVGEGVQHDTEVLSVRRVVCVRRVRRSIDEFRHAATELVSLWPVVRRAVRLAKPCRAAAGSKAASSQRLTVAADSLYFFFTGATFLNGPLINQASLSRIRPPFAIPCVTLYSRHGLGHLRQQ